MSWRFGLKPFDPPGVGDTSPAVGLLVSSGDPPTPSPYCGAAAVEVLRAKKGKKSASRILLPRRDRTEVVLDTGQRASPSTVMNRPATRSRSIGQ